MTNLSKLPIAFAKKLSGDGLILETMPAQQQCYAFQGMEGK